MNTSILVKRAGAAAVAALVAGGLVVGSSPAASAQVPSSTRPVTTITTTTRQLHCCLTIAAAPRSGLTADSVITVSLGATQDAQLREISAELCKGGGLCADVAPDPDADTRVVVSPPPSTSGTFEFAFRVGVGTYRGTRDGTSYPFECGPGEPCVLRVDAGHQFGSVRIVREFDLTYAGIPTTTTTQPTTTTTTAALPHPLCAHRHRIPAWLWRVVAKILGVTC